MKHQSEKGRAIYIPEVIPSIEKPPTAPVTSEYWRLPKNNNELIDAVKWAADKELSLQIKAPDFVTAEITESIDQSKMMLHLVNYKVDDGVTVKNIKVKIKIPENKQVKESIIVTPDKDSSQPVVLSIKDGYAEFRLPLLETYALIVFNF